MKSRKNRSADGRICTDLNPWPILMVWSKKTAISHAADNFHVHNDRVEDPGADADVGADADAIERQSARASADSDEPERVSGDA